jgi:hypothetical protein
VGQDIALQETALRDTGWRAAARGLSAFWRDGRRVDRVAYAVGALLAASGLLHLLVYALDDRPWEGPLSWRKPVTFGLSFGLTLVTITWLMALLRLRGRAHTWLLVAFTVACVGEVALVTLQAWRNVPSHFNRETPLDSAVATGLAIGGGVLVVTLVTVTVLAFRPAPAPPPVVLAIRVGLVALVGSLAAGAVMIATGMVRVIAGGETDAVYANGGWLKPTHAVLLHGVTVLPAIAWLAGYTGWTPRRQWRVTLVVCAGYAVAALVVSAANIAGG